MAYRLVAWLVFSAIGCYAVPALVTGQVCHNESGTVNGTCTLPGNTTAGNFLYLSIQVATGQTITVGPAMTGETFTLVNSTACSSGSNDVFVYYAKNLAGGQTAITATRSASTGEIHMKAGEFSGVLTTSPLDGSLTCGTGNSNAPSVTSGTPSQSNELAVSEVRVDAATTLTNPTGYSTLENPGVSDADAFNVISSATTAAWTSTGSATWYDTVTLFKPSGGAAPSIDSMSGRQRDVPDVIQYIFYLIAKRRLWRARRWIYARLGLLEYSACLFSAWIYHSVRIPAISRRSLK